MHLLDVYRSKLPQWALDNDVFDVRHCKKVPLGPSLPWYEKVPVGREKLRKFVEDMCKEAGIAEKKTNHSLQATGATAMFRANIPEKNHP